MRGRVLVAAGVALALMAGAAGAQSAETIKTCGLMMKSGGLIMTMRQQGQPRSYVEGLFADNTKGKVKEFAMWMLESAYTFDIQTDPSLASFAATRFQGMVYDQCMTENW